MLSLNQLKKIRIVEQFVTPFVADRCNGSGIEDGGREQEEEEYNALILLPIKPVKVSKI